MDTEDLSTLADGDDIPATEPPSDYVPPAITEDGSAEPEPQS